MGVRVSIKLDDAVRAELEAQARARGVALATYIGDLAADAARQARRARIRAASEAVGRYVASSPNGRDFYSDWG